MLGLCQQKHQMAWTITTSEKATSPDIGDGKSACRVPAIFVSTAMDSDWLPQGFIKELLELIAEYFCRFEFCGGAGSRKSGYLDGAYDKAQFGNPVGLCVITDTSSSTSASGGGRGGGGGRKTVLVVADIDNCRIRRVDLSDGGSVSTWVGTGQTTGVLQGRCRVSVTGGEAGTGTGAGAVATLCYPFSVCPDPIRPGCVYIGDYSSIRHCDGDTVSLVAGGTALGFADGAADQAKFYHIRGLLPTSNGETLYVADDKSYKIRAVNLKSRLVCTVCGQGPWTGISLHQVFGLCFDRSPPSSLTGNNKTPESAIFVTTTGAVRRCDIATGMVSRCSACLSHAASCPVIRHSSLGSCGVAVVAVWWSGTLTEIALVSDDEARTPFPPYGDYWQPYGLVSTATGYLIVADTMSRHLRAIQISTGVVKTIPYEMELGSPHALALDETTSDDRTGTVVVYVSDVSTNQIRSVSLPMWITSRYINQQRRGRATKQQQQQHVHSS